jgi:hypothetical protein
MSVLDITAEAGRAHKRRGDWSSIIASIVAWTFASTHGIVADWDGDAGEAWIRFLAGGHPLGYLNVSLPLLLTSGTSGVWPYPVVAIELPDLVHAPMACAPEVLAAMFQGVPNRSGFDAGRFTAESLWYATV